MQLEIIKILVSDLLIFAIVLVIVGLAVYALYLLAKWYMDLDIKEKFVVLISLSALATLLYSSWPTAFITLGLIFFLYMERRSSAEKR